MLFLLEVFTIGAEPGTTFFEIEWVFMAVGLAFFITFVFDLYAITAFLKTLEWPLGLAGVFFIAFFLGEVPFTISAIVLVGLIDLFFNFLFQA